MTGTYILTSNVWLLLAEATFLAALGVYSWRRRGVPGAGPLAIAFLFSTLWIVGAAGKSAVVDLHAKSAWHTFQSLWYIPFSAAMACFALEYVQPGRWLTRRNLILLATPPLLVMALFLTNDLHHLGWRRHIVDGFLRPEYGVGGWIIVGYAVCLALVQLAALSWLFVRSPQHRWPVALMLSVLILTRGVLFWDAVLLNPAVSLDTTVLTYLLPAVTYAIALFGFRIFDPLPAARQAMIEQMQAGVVVFDPHWQVVSLNPAAERMLGVRRGTADGKTWQELAPSGETLPARPDADAQRTGAASEVPEFSLGSGSTVRRYASTLSPLRDFRGLLMGHLLMLRDVTEQRRAQVQIVEQQRALATLHERERLARELHDSIGQVLGYASFQAEAANQLIDDGQALVASAQLTRLTNVLQDAHADVREQILNLSTTPSPQQPFFAAVQHYLDGFRSNYDIETGLTLDEGLSEAPFAPETQIQLFRILQEALSNARKHSQARRVQVTFEDGDGRVRMSIADDGCGFDVERAAVAGGSHMGLRFMRERVEELGGSMRVESAPGAGTCVIVEVPRKES